MASVIAIDIDGVLADFNGPFLVELRKDYGGPLSSVSFNCWGWADAAFGRSKARRTFARLLPSWWGDLPPLATEAEFARLRSLVEDGHFDVHFVTNRPVAAYRATELWLANTIECDPSDFTLVCLKDKANYCAKVGAVCLIDDKPENIIEVIEYNKTKQPFWPSIMPILFSQPWNEGVEVANGGDWYWRATSLTEALDMALNKIRWLEADSAAAPSPSTKLSNPKDIVGSNKLPLHLWPPTATAGGCLALLEGLTKYGRANWREVGVRASVYADALDRHMKAWFDGEDIDPDSGLPHLYKAIACVAILIDASAAGKLTDDRNRIGGYRELVAQLTPHVERIKAANKGTMETVKHYTIEDNPDAIERFIKANS